MIFFNKFLTSSFSDLKQKIVKDQKNKIDPKIISKYKPEDEKKASRLKPKKKIALVNSRVKPIFPEGYQINERYDFSDQIAMMIVKTPNPTRVK